MKQAGLATVESYSLIKTLEKALIANEDFSYGELLLTANCNVLLFFELLCAIHAEVTVLVLIHSISEALPLILSSFHLENPGYMFAGCLHFLFLTESKQERVHTSSITLCHSTWLFLAVHEKLLQMSQCPHLFPWGVVEKKNPHTGRMAVTYSSMMCCFWKRG